MPVEYAPRGLIGVLTPQANTTVEPEFSILWPPGFAMISTRMVSDCPTLMARLSDYVETLPMTLRQFHNAPIDIVCFACTGASYLIGPEGEAALVAEQSARLGIPFLTAGNAVTAGLHALSARRIGLVSPYPANLTEASVTYWTKRGFEVGAVAGAALGEGEFHPIYSMSAGTAVEALRGLDGEGLDAIIMLGTGMPTLKPILDAPRIGGAPVFSCILALAWATIATLERRETSADDLLAWIDGGKWRQRYAQHFGN